MDFWYNGTQVLFDIGLDIYAYHITAIIGPSGCGKSTLLRNFNRMNDLFSQARMQGEIMYQGQNICALETNVVAIRQQIGMVFQKANPFPLSIFENVAYGLRIQKKDEATVRKVVQESLEKADLWGEVHDRLYTSAFRLSGGQQQRLCIARALAVNPDVLLLDEPCSALDPIATAKIEQLLLKLKKEHTLIIVTHNMQQARRISDYTCYLLHGKVIEYASTAEVFEKPQQKLTSDYINGRFG